MINTQRKLSLILIFNLALMALEVAGGLLSGSLSLLSDAGHMLTDSLAIFLSYLAILWSNKPADNKRTFGYHRVEILTAMANGILLALVATYIFYEAIHRFMNPVAIDTRIMLIIAVAGLAGNIFGLFLLRHEYHDNLNIRGAFLHILGDAFSSIGVITSAIIIVFTKWYFVDSLMGMLIGGVVLRGAVLLILESGEVLLESTPKDIDINVIKKTIENIPGVKEIHDIHVWTITSKMRALAAHLLLSDITLSESRLISSKVKEVLKDQFKILHTTLELESTSCQNGTCEFNHANSKGAG